MKKMRLPLKKRTLGILIMAAALVTAAAVLAGCQSWQRSIKSIGSNVSGLERTVTVYSYSGEKIAEYTGKFDIQENDNGTKVLFDLDGKRTIIYNAIVIAQEK